MNGKRLILIALMFLLTACAAIEINDDGSATIKLDDCDGVSFNIVIEQNPGPGGLSPSQEGNVATAGGGKINFKVRDPNKFDFKKEFKITLVSSGPVTSETCEWANGTWVFTGQLVLDKGIFTDTYKVMLKDFHKTP